VAAARRILAPMRATLAIAVSLPCVLPSCDDAPLLQSQDGRYRVVHAGEGRWLEPQGRQEMEAALARCEQIDLVYAHNDPMAHGAVLAARQQQRHGIAFVGVDALQHEGRRYVQEQLLDVTIEYPTCGAAALDLAVLACRGVELPRELKAGTRVYTRSDASGRPMPAAGDAILAMLRHQHAALLHDGEGKALRIGMAQCNDAEPWREAMREEMRTWAAAHPHVQFDYRDAANDSQKQRDIVADFTTQAYDAIVVSPKESLALAPVCREAMQKGVKVVVLDRALGSDDFTCFVGGDNVAIGRTAAEEIRRLLPAGGAIVELQGLMTSSPAQERHRGFVEGLGLQAPQ